MILPDCPQCAAQLDDPHLLGAAASVGISRNISTEQVLAEYLRYHHRRFHQDTG